MAFPILTRNSAMLDEKLLAVCDFWCLRQERLREIDPTGSSAMPVVMVEVSRIKLYGSDELSPRP
jgi:hypothetical protein